MKYILLALLTLSITACSSTNSIIKKEETYTNNHAKVIIKDDDKKLIEDKKATYISFEFCIKDDCVEDSVLVKEQKSYPLLDYKIHFNVVNSDILINLEEQVNEIYLLKEPIKKKSLLDENKEIQFNLGVQKKSNYIHLLKEPILNNSLKRGSILFKHLEIKYFILQN